MKWNPTTSTKSLSTKAGSVYNGSAAVRRGTVAYRSEWDADRAVNEALDRVTWVFRCVDAIASNAARQEVIVRRDNPWDGEIVDSADQLYRVFNSKANNGESAIAFRYRLSAQLLLSRKGVFVQVVRSNRGEVIALYLLPPERMEPIKDEENLVSGWKLTTTTNENGVVRTREQEFSPEEIIWLRRPDPFDPYGALTPLKAAGLAIETDWLAKMYNRNFLLNDGRPGGMVIIKGDMMEEDKEELRARFSGGVSRAGRISVIASENGADFVDTAVNPRDAQYQESRQSTKDEILLAFGVPESVMANASGRTFDNAEVERLVFWQETMLPHLDLITRPMDDLDANDDHFLAINLSRVDVLQRMEMKRREFLLREYDAGATDVNEYLTATGREGIPGPWGKVHWISKNKKMAAMSDGSEFPEPVAQDVAKPTAGQPQSQDVNEQPEDDPNQRDDERLPEMPNTETVNAGQTSAEGTVPLAVKSEFVDRASSDYEVYGSLAANTVDRLAERVERVVGQKISGPKFRSAFFKGGSPEELLELAFSDETWIKQFSEDVKPVAKAAFADSNRRFSKLLEVDEVTDPDIKIGGSLIHSLKVMIAEELDKFVKSESTDIEAFRITLSEKIQSFLSSEKAADHCKSVAFQAYNEGIDAAIQKAGCEKMWVSLGDSPGQRKLDGVVTNGSGFKLGRKSMKVPTGTLAKAVIVPVVDGVPVV
jgi:HK97 family phage portal protein